MQTRTAKATHTNFLAWTAMFKLCLLLVFFQVASAGRLRRQSLGTSGRLTLSLVGKNGSLDFVTEESIEVNIQGQLVKLAKYQTSNESSNTASLYWTTPENLAPSENGFTSTLKIRPSKTCGQYKIADFRATVAGNNGAQKTFAVPPSALGAVYECGGGNVEKTLLVKPVDEMDCVEPAENAPEGMAGLLSQPPYYKDGEVYTFNCYARCTCVKSRAGCISVCAPFELTDDTCRKVIRGSLCCEVPECLPEAQTQLNESCALGLKIPKIKAIEEATDYPPWVARVVSGAGSKTSDIYVTIINENWILGPATVLQRAEAISTSKNGTMTHSISAVFTAKGYADPVSTPQNNIALAKLSSPQLSIIFTGHGARGVNLPWPSLCQRYFDKGCPLSVYPFVSTIESDSKCPKISYGSAFACAKSQILNAGLQSKKSVIGSGVVSLRSDTVHDLIGVLAETIDLGDGPDAYHTVISLCPHLDWIKETLKEN